MTVIVQSGCAARSVSSVAEVALLGALTATEGVALANASRWALTVTTDQDVTLRVYKAAGPNAGLVILADLTDVVTSAAPKIIEFDGEASQRVYVSAQASSTTAAVNCDFRAVSL